MNTPIHDTAPTPGSTLTPGAPLASARTAPAPAEAARPTYRATPIPAVPAGPAPKIGRIPVLDTAPVVDGGRYPAKAVVGEAVEVSAAVFREGHDAVAATVVLIDPDGVEHTRAPMRPVGLGTDRFTALVTPDREGTWTYLVEGWADPYGTWEHDATIKIAADVDTLLMLEEGARVLERAIAHLQRGPHASALREAITGLRDSTLDVRQRLAAGTSAAVHEALAAHPLRDYVCAGAALRLLVQRDRALFSSSRPAASRCP